MKNERAKIRVDPTYWDRHNGELLRAILDPSDHNAHAQAITTLGRSSRIVLRKLHNLLNDETDIDAQSRHILAIGKIGRRRSLSHLTPYLRDQHAEIRAITVTSLGLIRGRRAAKLLIPMLDDPSPKVRAATLDAIYCIGRAAVPTLIASLDAGMSAQNIKDIVMILAQNGRYSAMQALIKLLDTSDLPLQIATIHALGYTYDGRAIRVLQDIAQAHPDRKLRQVANKVINRMKYVGGRCKPNKSFRGQVPIAVEIAVLGASENQGDSQ